VRKGRRRKHSVVGRPTKEDVRLEVGRLSGMLLLKLRGIRETPTQKRILDRWEGGKYATSMER